MPCIGSAECRSRASSSFISIRVTGDANVWLDLRAAWQALPITASEHERGALPIYFRSESEFAEPFQAAGLKLEKMFTHVFANPCAEKYDDATAFARCLVPMMRARFDKLFFDALDVERPIAERRTLVDQVYDDYEERVRKDPRKNAAGPVKCFVLARKTGE